MGEPVDFVAEIRDGKIYDKAVLHTGSPSRGNRCEGGGVDAQNNSKTVSFLIAFKRIKDEEGKVNLYGTEVIFPNVADYVVGETVYLRNDFDKMNPLVVESVGDVLATAVSKRRIYNGVYEVHLGFLSKEPISRAEADAAQARLEAKHGSLSPPKE